MTYCVTCRLGAAQAMARCADAMGRLSDLNDISDVFYLEALSKCASALRAAEHDAEGTGTKSSVADALAVSSGLLLVLPRIGLGTFGTMLQSQSYFFWCEAARAALMLASSVRHAMLSVFTSEMCTCLPCS